MLILALSNLTHRKVRSGLSVLAVAIAITLLLVLMGLANGTLNEVSRRMESVEAEIVVRDKHFDLGSMSGGKLWEKEIPKISSLTLENTPVVERVIPVFLGRMKLAGLSQNVFGVRPDDFIFFAGNRKIVAGEVFQDISSAQDAIDRNQSDIMSEMAALPLVIDQRLAAAAKLEVGDSTFFGDNPANIVGIVETGVAGRVFAPINRLRAANGIAAETAHMFFVKAVTGLSTDQLQQLRELIEQKTHRAATLVANYGQVLSDNFRNLTIFVSMVSVIALVICFLFICVTMYTIVLERGKEIAILQSLGATRITVLMQTIQEACVICCIGTGLGIVFTFGVRYLVQTLQPLMTIEVRLSWTLLAITVGIGGGVISALYPGYLALKHDPVEALSFD